MAKAKAKVKTNLKPVPKEKKRMGAPPMFSMELFKKIARAISLTTEGLEQICAANPDFPNPSTIYEWRIEYPDFGDMYMEARREQAHLLAAEILKIADNTQQDTITKEDKNGREYEVSNSEWIARSRLRVEARKWIASKLLPKVYGEKIQQETTVTIKHEDLLKELE